jgi:hypothetical protein
MQIASLGGIGLGLVWGWLLALVSGRERSLRPYLSYLWLALATLLVALQVLLLTNWDRLVVACFLGALACGVFVHLGWREDLSKRASL